MDKKTGILGYNYDNDRYGILNSMDLWETEGLNCGEGLEIFINGKWVSDRLEMTCDKKWYLVESKLQGNQLEGLKIKY
ncbi:hypothetical protein FDB24_16710 [Clostridium botulinum]|uniref:DUF5348 domain-containing protein n=1 Tax=Clostridium botulinum TaxID=1491 RepID=UPI0007733A01|nr:DUF5348 domain-containing protein [Clostridium botulinum]NFL88153.1 hypothetical protein [Clostridium botulinum]NFO22854.1 hypothetical protein [Clostridium botulinum]HBJ2623691.1 DUF5348 domain-containing protein [Clostridium botulinum]